MLTRLEADGFKNLVEFSVDFAPFTCLAGPNGVGKSNVFDAIHFLSLLADYTLIEAALAVRGTDRDTADLKELFWTDGNKRARSFRLAAEMVVSLQENDDFGRPATASSTFLRYEVEIGYEDPEPGGVLGRLTLLAERLDYIKQEDAAKRLRFPHSANSFRKVAIQNKRKSPNGFISTETAPDGKVEINVHQDGGSRGNPQKAPAETAPKTIIATTNTSVTPTILVARREMQRWRILSLEPSSMRRADKFHDDPHVSAHGDHLPATLYRLAKDAESGDESRDSAYGRVANRLGQFVPVRQLRVNRDDVRQLLIVEVEEAAGAVLPSRSLSDGTLRFLTLSILAEDPEVVGLLCMEEPENGIHPEKMPAMVRLLRDLAVDPKSAPSADNPMRQIIIATHSPVLVQLLAADDLLCAVPTTIRSAVGVCTTLHLKPLRGSWRSSAEEPGVSTATILAYLTAPPGAQLSLSNLVPDLRQEPN